MLPGFVMRVPTLLADVHFFLVPLFISGVVVAASFVLWATAVDFSSMRLIHLLSMRLIQLLSMGLPRDVAPVATVKVTLFSLDGDMPVEYTG